MSFSGVAWPVPRVLVLVLLFAATLVWAADDRQRTLQLRIDAACELQVTGTEVVRSEQQGVTTVRGVSRFAYRMRSSRDTGGGEIRLRWDSAFAALKTTFAARVTSPGEGLTGTETVGAEGLVVIRFGANARTPTRGAGGEVRWAYTLPSLDSANSAPIPQLNVACR